MWTKKQLAQHITAAKRLVKVKNAIAKYFVEHPSVTEYEAMGEVLRLFKKNGLVMDDHVPIVAYHTNTSHVHYFPEATSAKALEKETLILLDIWGRLNEPGAPYADFTWMFYFGDNEPDPGYHDAFTFVAQARDTALVFIKKTLKAGQFPIGADCDAASRNFLKNNNLAQYFLHTLGHSLGTKSPHGIYGGLRPRTKAPLVPNLGYTIEPGVYFEKHFGVRSEIDFYMTKDKKLKTTLPIQQEIEVIRPIESRVSNLDAPASPHNF